VKAVHVSFCLRWRGLAFSDLCRWRSVRAGEGRRAGEVISGEYCQEEKKEKTGRRLGALLQENIANSSK
jgi:hypothetical protein